MFDEKSTVQDYDKDILSAREYRLSTLYFHCTPGNPVAHIGKMQHPACDIYGENAHFDWYITDRYEEETIPSRI